MAKRPELFVDLLDRLAKPDESWADLAERSGVSVRTIRLWIEKGAARPYRSTVAKLAKALGVDPATVRAAIEAQRAAK